MTTQPKPAKERRVRSQRNRIVTGTLTVIAAVEAFNQASPGLLPMAVAQAIPGIGAVVGLLVNQFWKR